MPVLSVQAIASPSSLGAVSEFKLYHYLFTSLWSNVEIFWRTSTADGRGRAERAFSSSFFFMREEERDGGGEGGGRGVGEGG